MFLLTANGHGLDMTVLGFITLALIAAVIGELFVRKGQPNIVGIMITAIVLSNVFGISNWGSEPIPQLLAEIGAIIILFYAGLESDLSELAGKFYDGLLVAIVGVLVPFILIYIYIFYIYGSQFATALMVANVFVATSVAVTVSEFNRHNAQRSRISDIILVAAVIDDILGMLILGIVEPISNASSEGISVFKIVLQIGLAVLFIVGGIVLGRIAASRFSTLFTELFHSGNKGKLLLAFLFCSVFVFISLLVGLAPIIGAFTAGLVLDHTHFKKFEKATAESVEELVKPIRNLTLPFFFFMAGISVNLSYLLDWQNMVLVVILFILASIGKMASGLAISLHGSRFGLSNAIIGIAMNPRGEVGMVIALIGKHLGLFSDQLYSVIVIVIFLTTVIPPLMLNVLIPRYINLYAET